MSLHPPIHRELDGDSSSNNGNDDNMDPYLICEWIWQDSADEITQNCQWRFPNTITTSAGVYEVTSTCSWETFYSDSFVCDVSSFDAKGARTITYTAECSVSAIGKGARNACQAVSASIPTRDPTCQDCEWNMRRRGRPQRRRWLDGTGDEEDNDNDNDNGTSSNDLFCDQECWTATELCRNVAFPKLEKKAQPDYHGIPWADSLVETMKWAVLRGEANVPIALYDVPMDQPSLQAQDFALGMTFYCPSGAYQGSELLPVDAMLEGRSGGWGILKGVLILMVASALLLVYLKRYGHCRQRPRRKSDEQKAVSSRLTVALEEEQQQQQPPSPTSPPPALVPLPSAYQPRMRAASSPVLLTMAGEDLVVQDKIWRPRRRRNTTSSSWQDGAEEEGSVDSDDMHFPNHHHHVVEIMLEKEGPIMISPFPDELSSVGSTDYENILQEVI
jgi:hypothetical protein